MTNMPRIIYLHGFASSPSSSKARFFRDRLVAAGADVSVPDLAEGDFERLTLSRQLAVLARAAGAGPVRLMGSSMGGYLAALYAARNPLVERLVLLAPAFRFHTRWTKRLGPAESDRWRATDSLEVYHYGEGRTRKLRYDLMADSEQYEEFPEVRQPTLIVHGRHDDVVPVEFSQQFAAVRSNVQLEVVDSGHDLLNVLERIGDRVVEILCGADRLPDPPRRE
jgi:pimeloyl-ACP methyl ester carboxylesterase